MSRPNFWSNLYHILLEECDGLRRHVLWQLRKRLTKQETKEERTKRFDDWTQVRKDILQRSHSDLWEGSRPEATGLQKSFFLHLRSESERLMTAGSAEVLHNSPQGLDSHFSGWAAHFLPVEEFENLYVESVSLNVGSSAQAMVYAWRSVAHLRHFPRLVTYQTKCLSENYLDGVEDEKTRIEALRQTRSTILAQMEKDLEEGRKASVAFANGGIGKFAKLAHRRYFEFFEAETHKAQTEFEDKEWADQYYEEIKIHGWASHFLSDCEGLSHRDFEGFFARTIIANQRPEVLAAQRALRAARSLPAFPPYESSFNACAMPRSL